MVKIGQKSLKYGIFQKRSDFLKNFSHHRLRCLISCKNCPGSKSLRPTVSEIAHFGSNFRGVFRPLNIVYRRFWKVQNLPWDAFFQINHVSLNSRVPGRSPFLVRTDLCTASNIKSLRYRAKMVSESVTLRDPKSTFLIPASFLLAGISDLLVVS